jgi:hypothetical protein
MKAIEIDYLVWRSDSDEDVGPGRLGAYWPNGERAHIEFHGIRLHIDALRVHDVDEDGRKEQRAWHPAFACEVSDLQTWALDKLQAGKLPGHEGDWIIWLQPWSA